MRKKNEAEKLGKKLLKKLGIGWKLEVWENLGWHYATTNGPLNVSEFYRGKEEISYFCLMSDNPKLAGGGANIWHLDENWSEDPWICIQRQVKEARKVVDELSKTVEAAEKILVIRGR